MRSATKGSPPATVRAIFRRRNPPLEGILRGIHWQEGIRQDESRENGPANEIYLRLEKGKPSNDAEPYPSLLFYIQEGISKLVRNLKGGSNQDTYAIHEIISEAGVACERAEQLLLDFYSYGDSNSREALKRIMDPSAFFCVVEEGLEGVGSASASTMGEISFVHQKQRNSKMHLRGVT